MGRKKDVETGVPETFYYYAPPPPPIYPPPRVPYLAWLVPLIFIADVLIFMYTMYENDCPATHKDPELCLFYQHLGRFSFSPVNENALLGPSISTLQRLGGLQLTLVQDGEWWRLISCLWLHAGAFHLLINMISLLFIGVRLEEEFGFWRIGPLYLLSGFGGSLVSCLNFLHSGKVDVVSVGASGALFGLLGSMLSELITNWTLYANKCSAMTSLLLVIGFNLAIGLLPGVDNSAHIGGFISGFLLGFILLIRPQYGYINSKYLPPGYSPSKVKSRHGCCQYFLFLIAFIILITGYGYGMLELLISAHQGKNRHAIKTMD